MKKILCVLITLIMLLCLTACGGDSDAVVYFEFVTPPRNLDPQTAYTDSELMIVRNVFEGLLRKDRNGKIVNGVCESYEKNDNVYTFKLKKDLKWNDGTPLTAADFVFAFRRAVIPKTEAPFVSRLFCIKNAKEINAGVLDATALGIKGKGESLTITLTEDNPDFKEALTSSICMPCNEKFFNKTKGKYGQDAENLLSCGSYFLRKWVDDEFGIRIYKNEQYSGDFEAKNASVFFSCVDKKTQLTRLIENDSDISFLPGEEMEEAETANIKITGAQNITWFLTLNYDYDLNIRTALFEALSGSVYESELPAGFSAASSIYPEILGIKGAENAGLCEYNLETARKRFSDAVSHLEDKKLPDTTLYYYSSPAIKPALTAALGHWQQNLSAFINLKESNSLDAFEAEIGKRTLQLSLFPVTARNGSVSEYMQKFGKAGNPVTVQEELLADKTIIPFAFESTNIGYSERLSGVYCDNGNGYIDFCFIEKSN